MAPAIAAILRALIGRGAAAAAARPAAASVAQGGVRAAGQRGVSGLVNRVLQRFQSPPVHAPASAAAKPQVNYSQMLSNMGSQTAYQNAVQQPTPAPPRTVGGLVKSLGSTVANATGMSDLGSGFKKLFTGDVMGAVKDFTKSITKAGTAIVGLPVALQRWTESLVESRREMTRYNGTIATAFSRMDSSNVRNQILTASNTQGSTRSLVEAKTQLDSTVRPMNQDFATLTNSVGWIGAKIGSTFGSAYPLLRKIAGYGFVLDAIEKNTRKASEKDLPQGRGFLKELEDGKHLGNGARPPLPPIR